MSAAPPDGPASPERDGEQATCAACPHDLAGHDRLGVRFCAATTDLALDRGCICVK